MKHLLIIITIFLSSSSLFAQSGIEGCWNGVLSVGNTSLTIVFNISSGQDGTYVCTMDSPDQGAKGIIAEMSIQPPLNIVINVPSIAASFKAMMLNGSLVGTFSQMGKELPLTLKRGKEILNRPQTPVGPFPYSEEEVTFTNDKAGATLAGTLTIPEGASESTPVVIMVTGSGLEDRNEEIFEHKPFWILADHLARNGIASLRYDDRTYGKSHGGDARNATTPDFMEDALAGIDYLKSKGSFGKIGVMGHSEGASIAFMLGAKGCVDFVISLAGIGVKGDEALAAQANRVMELKGIQKKLSVQEYRSAATSRPNRWIEWFIDYDPVPDIGSCKCPVFAANGNKDVQIISSLNLVSIRMHLPPNPMNSVKEYESLNHLFQHCTTGDSGEYRRIEETFSPEVMADISKWITDIIINQHVDK